MKGHVIIVIIVTILLAAGSFAWYLVGKKSQIPRSTEIQFLSVDDLIPEIPERYSGSGDPMQDFLDLKEDNNDQESR